MALDGARRVMPHIELDESLPGIRGLFAFRPETGQPLQQLAEALLRGDSTLERGERELIAAYVSRLNDCNFCCLVVHLPPSSWRAATWSTPPHRHGPGVVEDEALLRLAGGPAEARR